VSKTTTRMLVVTPFYAPAWEHGGIVRSTYGWTNALADLGIEVKVMTTYSQKQCEDKEYYATRLSRVGVARYARWNWTGNLFMSPSLARACHQCCPKFDIVHSVGLWNFPSQIAGLVAGSFGVPHIVSLHGMLMPVALARHALRKTLLMRLMERRRLAAADAIICASQVEKQEYDELSIRDNARVLPNIVTLPDKPPDRKRPREENGLGNKFVMLFVGRMAAIKALDWTIRAFKGAVEQHPRARLIIAGPEGDHSSVIRSLVKSLRLEKTVLFTGMVSGQEYWDIVASVDLLVLNSHSENFGLAAAEALGLGIPVLVSDKVGLSDMVEQYEAGIVTPVDVEAIRRGMCQAITGEVDLAAMGRRGEDLVRNHFSASMVGRRFLGLVEDVLAARRTRPSD
jgi:glycosyltransferase involved in cell wall biosynthesis